MSLRRVGLWIFGGLLVLTALFALLRIGGNAKASKSAENFALPPVRSGGQAVNLAAWRGHPVVLNFFAAWCVPCRTELPRFEAAYTAHHGAVRFVGVDDQDSRSRAIALLDATGVTYPTGYDPSGSVARKYGLRKGLPVTVFISADGRVIGEKLGELDAKELGRWITRLTVEDK